MSARSYRSNAIKNIVSLARMTGAAAIFSLVGGLAVAQNAAPVNADPLESFNRGIYRFNDGVDRAVLKPVASAYREVLPSMMRAGVNNFFGNISDVWNFANNVMQLKLQNSAETFMRLNVNTFFGLGGLLDIASEAGIERHTEDFGQTLGRWGVPAGPYVVLPLLGPSTLRDTAALPVDRYGDPLSHVHDVAARNSLSVLRVVDTRSNFLRAGQLLQDAALDPYSFTRDAFLQKRQSDIYDGSFQGESKRLDEGKPQGGTD